MLLVDYPSGHNFFTPALMRGEGRMCVLGEWYKKKFRRMTVDTMQKFDAWGLSFDRHFPDTVENGIWSRKDAFVFVKQRFDHFDAREDAHFYEIQKEYWTDACKLSLMNCGILSGEVFSWSSTV